jgi:hypothetical protein
MRIMMLVLTTVKSCKENQTHVGDSSKRKYNQNHYIGQSPNAVGSNYLPIVRVQRMVRSFLCRPSNGLVGFSALDPRDGLIAVMSVGFSMFSGHQSFLVKADSMLSTTYR